MASRSKKDYFCDFVSEDVEIALKYKLSINPKSKNGMFVQCNQLECQYLDLNKPPCPLGLDLFAAEIIRRAKNRRDRIMEY